VFLELGLENNMNKKLATLGILGTLIVGGATISAETTNKISSEKLQTKFNSSVELKQKYSLENSSFKRIAKANPKDKIEVTVGDDTPVVQKGLVGGLLGKTDKDFTPKVKISRWDDEVSISLTPKMETVATKNKDVVIDGEKIKYKNGAKSEMDFYELPVSDVNPEGGYEMEWVLNEKPTTNKVEFNIDTKGLDFFYQPALNIEMASSTCTATDCGGSHRPENVVGSYAVYASEQKTNYVGGKEYKTGQVGMIYRPKIIDSAGTEVWGELHIENGILSVTIPQEFLDKAVYPVRHAAGLTFGYTTVGSSIQTFSNESLSTGNGDGFLAEAGTATSISMYARASSISYPWTMQLGIYTKDSDTVASYVANTSSITLDSLTPDWKTSNLTSSASISASYYHLFSFGYGEIYWRGVYYYDSGGTLEPWSYSASHFTWPSPITNTVTGTKRKYSIYATYTAAEEEETSTPTDDIIWFD